MLRQEVRRQESVVGSVMHRVILRHNVRVVRPIERYIAEEGAAPVFLQESHRLVGKHRTGVPGGWLRRSQLAVFQVAEPRLERVSHAPQENPAGALETPPQ